MLLSRVAPHSNEQHPPQKRTAARITLLVVSTSRTVVRVTLTINSGEGRNIIDQLNLTENQLRELNTINYIHYALPRLICVG